MKHPPWTWPAPLGLLSGTTLADSIVRDNGDRRLAETTSTAELRSIRHAIPQG